MQIAILTELLAVLVPALIAGTNKLVKGNRKYVIAVIAFFVLRRMARSAAVMTAQENIQAEGVLNANALANLYNSALNPSGFAAFQDYDGTNEELLFYLAANTPNFNQVATVYRTLYKAELNELIKGELSASDYQKFLQILNRI